MTIKDIAQMTGVSLATVSRVINGSPNVTEKTKRLVEDAINRTGYHPNSIGRNLKTARTMRLLVLLPTMENTFYAKVLKGIEDEASHNGYQVIIGITHNKLEIETKYIDMLKSKQVDGLILTNTCFNKYDLNRLADSFPIVTLSHKIEGTTISSVTIDNVSAATVSTSHLIELGHKKIAMLSGVYYYYPSMCREEGYKNALANHDIPFSVDYLIRKDFDFQGGFDGAKKLMSLKKPPTAIFCAADSIAIGAMKYLMEENLNVSIVGFDNVSESEFVYTGITTINQPKYDMGKTSVELLLKKIEDISSPITDVSLPFNLIIRGSSFPIDL